MDPPPAKVRKMMASDDQEMIKLNKEIDNVQEENNSYNKLLNENLVIIREYNEKLQKIEVQLQETVDSSSRLALENDKAHNRELLRVVWRSQASLQETISENKKIIAHNMKLIDAKMKDTKARVVRVDRNESISTQARKIGGADYMSEKKPIYMHWFGLDMLKAYQSAKLQIGKGEYPIKIDLDESTYMIDQDSLQNVTTAIRCACKICPDRELTQGRHGLMSLPDVRSTELAFSCLVSRALDRFIFPDDTTGACLHQAPCRKDKNTPKKADIYIVKFNEGFIPGDPLSLSDIKNLDFDHTDRETTLYSGVGVEEGGCLDQFPVLIGVPTTYHKLELQVLVNVEGMIWKLVVANGSPSDGAILCTLRAGVHYLMEQDMLMMSEPLQSPEPYKEMSLYSICGPTERVFHKKDTDAVVKFFDTEDENDDFFNPHIMADLIKKCPTILPQTKLSHDPTERVYQLSYRYIPGIDGRARQGDKFELKQFLGVVETLSDMHQNGFVHGDIRLANMVFPKDGKSSLIDFDFVGKHSNSVYFSRYNCELQVRDSRARPNSPMKMEHDRAALKNVIGRVCPESPEKANILSMLMNQSHTLQEIVNCMKQM